MSMPGKREMARVCRWSKGWRKSEATSPSRFKRGIFGAGFAPSGGGATNPLMASARPSSCAPVPSSAPSNKASDESAARFMASVPSTIFGISLNSGNSWLPANSTSSTMSGEWRPFRNNFSKASVWSMGSPFKRMSKVCISFGYWRGMRFAISRSSGVSLMPSATSSNSLGNCCKTGVYRSSSLSLPPMIFAPPSNPIARDMKEPKSSAVPATASVSSPTCVRLSEIPLSTGRSSSRVHSSFHKGMEPVRLWVL
mmetsp:Transcript_108871/g.314386  ORF Transcript_108871/g.314386 Transcript_108871/m.314386 type:complete len:254 (-) Transcript_108871:854-1615(-)